jgi:hypothetical protein
MQEQQGLKYCSVPQSCWSWWIRWSAVMTFLSFSGWKPCFSADHKQFIADNWSVIGCYFMLWNKLQGLSVSFSTIDQMQRSMSWLVFYNRHLMTWGQNDLNDLGVKWLRANRLGGKSTWGWNDLGAKRVVFHTLIQYVNMATCQGLNFITAIAIEETKCCGLLRQRQQFFAV